MTQKVPNHLALLCHPYLFALKEGGRMGEDLMDYSLLLLQRNCVEVIRSPRIPPKKLLPALLPSLKKAKEVRRKNF